MSIVVSALSPGAPDNYLSDKLRACRMNPSAAELEQLSHNIGANHLPLAADGELPTFTAAQSKAVELYKQQVLDNLAAMLPLVPGESVEATGITNDYLPLGLGLVSAQKKYCLLYYRPEDINEPYDDNSARLVIFSVADGQPRWKSNGAAHGWRAYMQQDRNFVVYGDVPDSWKQADADANKNIWDPYPVEKSDQYNLPNSSAVFSSNTATGGGTPLDYYLVMQDDGELTIYPTGSPDLVWTTG